VVKIATFVKPETVIKKPLQPVMNEKTVPMLNPIPLINAL
jgi:hypothetical protein